MGFCSVHFTRFRLSTMNAKFSSKLTWFSLRSKFISNFLELNYERPRWQNEKNKNKTHMILFVERSSTATEEAQRKEEEPQIPNKWVTFKIRYGTFRIKLFNHVNRIFRIFLSECFVLFLLGCHQRVKKKIVYVIPLISSLIALLGFAVKKKGWDFSRIENWTNRIHFTHSSNISACWRPWSWSWSSWWWYLFFSLFFFDVTFKTIWQ